MWRNTMNSKIFFNFLINFLTLFFEVQSPHLILFFHAWNTRDHKLLLKSRVDNNLDWDLIFQLYKRASTRFNDPWQSRAKTIPSTNFFRFLSTCSHFSKVIVMMSFVIDFSSRLISELLSLVSFALLLPSTIRSHWLSVTDRLSTSM